MQAARDVEGRGVMETSADRRDAKLFFFSRSPERSFYRHLWFGMAGVDEPRHEEMEAYVVALARGRRMS